MSRVNEPSGRSKNTHQRWKYLCMADLLFDCFRFDQYIETVVNLTEAKQLNPYKIKRMSSLKLYSSLSSCSLGRFIIMKYVTNRAVCLPVTLAILKVFQEGFNRMLK